MMATPDELQADIWKNDLKDNMKQGSCLLFAHGFNVHFKLIEPRPDMDVAMVAPKGPGHTVRGEYLKGGGVPCLIAIHQNARTATDGTHARATIATRPSSTRRSTAGMAQPGRDAHQASRRDSGMARASTDSSGPESPCRRSRWTPGAGVGPLHVKVRSVRPALRLVPHRLQPLFDGQMQYLVKLVHAAS